MVCLESGWQLDIKRGEKAFFDSALLSNRELLFFLSVCFLGLGEWWYLMTHAIQAPEWLVGWLAVCISECVRVWMRKRVKKVLDVRKQFEGWRTPLLYARPWRIPPLFLSSSSSLVRPLNLISSSVRSTMLGRNVSLTGETKIMFMGSSSTEIIFHISATAWALWGSKSDFLLPVPMGNIMGKKTDWIVREMAWRSCGRLFLCLGVLLLCAYIIKTGSTREGKRMREGKIKMWMLAGMCGWENEPHYGNRNFMPRECNKRPSWNNGSVNKHSHQFGLDTYQMVPPRWWCRCPV